MCLHDRVSLSFVGNMTRHILTFDGCMSRHFLEFVGSMTIYMYVLKFVDSMTDVLLCRW